MQEAVKYLGQGLGSGVAGSDQPRFYYHLGDALQRLGKPHQAYRVYDEAARKGYFLSRLQRSAYNCKGLTAKPWWSLRQTGQQADLEVTHPITFRARQGSQPSWSVPGTGEALEGHPRRGPHPPPHERDLCGHRWIPFLLPSSFLLG